MFRRIILLSSVFLALFVVSSHAQTNFTFRVMAANLPGDPQKYEAPQIRILQGLSPDIVAIQEFNYLGNSVSEIRAFVDTAFGTNFVYFRESGYSIPNGIISRWPILSSGSWPDSVVPDRGFAWAQIDLPGTNDLYVVSVHLYASGSAGDRNTEALAIKSLVQANFPADAWVVVAGDMNTDTRSEAAITTFKTFLSDSPIPTDAATGGDPDTNLNRSKPYDYVLPSFSLTNALTNVVIGSQSFPKGLVFDSRVYTPLAEVSPVQFNDSASCQHMAILKDFAVTATGTNPPAAPTITDQPDDLAVVEGNDAAFSVTATGSVPLAYQWRFSGVSLPGATNAAYVRVNAQPEDAGDYDVVVTNSSGSVTSSIAVLTVLPPGGGGPVSIITQWDFNSVPPDGSTSTGTLIPSIGAGTASTVGGITQTFFSGSGSTDPATSDNSGLGTQDYPAQGTANKTAGAQFAVSTIGMENISIAWDVRASNTGSKYARLQYTTNGSTYTDFPTAVINPTSYDRRTNDLAAFPGVSDNPDFGFRIVSEFESTATGSGPAAYAGAGTTYGTAGTLRYDMVTVYGSAMADPPQILSLDIYGESAGLTITGAIGTSLDIEYIPGLANTNSWLVATNLTLQQQVELWLDTTADVKSQPARFYRLNSTP
jgi:endonuclease/exonuclease/phosphatase family metal-dependent hydrolase